MPFRFATQDLDYSDYASGRVLYSQPGVPAFPVRLASEIFQRARQILGPERGLVIYDPACGGAFHLCAVGFLHGSEIEAVIASDADTQALALARRNLALLSPEGLERRAREIEALLAQFGKASHAAALDSVAVLRRQLESAGGPIRIETFQANALDPDSLRAGLAGEAVDLVFSDVPYGQLSAWQPAQAGSPGLDNPLWQMLEVLLPALSPASLVAIAADKHQKIAHPGYQRVQHFVLGKRQVAFLSPR